MDQEFTTSTGYKFFYGAVALALLFLWVLVLIQYNANSGGALIFMSVLALAGSSAIIINLVKRKVVCTDYSVSYVSIWGMQEIENTEIKGFRVGEKAILIQPVTEGYRKLRIRDYASLGDSKGLIEFLSSKFTDLDKVDYEEEKEEILQSIDLGPTLGDRESLFKKSATYAMIYGFVALALFLISCYLHSSNQLLSLLILLCPLAGIAIMYFSKGIIRVFAKKNSAHPSIFTGLFLSTMATVTQGFLNSQILSYDNLWLPAAILLIATFSALYYLSVKVGKATFKSQVICIVLSSAVYGFGATVLVNCVFDKSTPEVFQTRVTETHISHGKSTTYHITISEWGEHHKEENITVARSFYDQVQVGSKIQVNEKKGLLGLPWFYLTE